MKDTADDMDMDKNMQVCVTGRGWKISSFIFIFIVCVYIEMHNRKIHR